MCCSSHTHTVAALCAHCRRTHCRRTVATATPQLTHTHCRSSHTLTVAALYTHGPHRAQRPNPPAARKAAVGSSSWPRSPSSQQCSSKDFISRRTTCFYSCIHLCDASGGAACRMEAEREAEGLHSSIVHALSVVPVPGRSSSTRVGSRWRAGAAWQNSAYDGCRYRTSLSGSRGDLRAPPLWVRGVAAPAGCVTGADHFLFFGKLQLQR